MLKKVALVVGHDSKAQGAIASAPLSETEYTYNVELARMIQSHLIEDKLLCQTFYRNHGGIINAYRLVNAYDPIACVELHFNSSGLGTVQGTETLFSSKNIQNGVLATALQAAMCGVLSRQGSQNRGVKLLRPGDRGYTNVSLAKGASALVEPFFGDCPIDAGIGKTRKPELAFGIAEAILFFIEKISNSGNLH